MRITIYKSILLSFSFFIYTAVSGQSEDAGKIADRLNHFKERTLQEKIFLHSDRNSYLAGETMWFKVYNLQAGSHKPTEVSKVAYVEVLDQEHNPVLQAKVALKEGSGQGTFQLPATLNSGNYLVRAYTNWMKNFDAGLYFQKPVAIINTFKPLGLKQEALSSAYDVQFFPEGGHLVNGLKSVVAFKAVDKQGKGTSFKGVVLNQANDTLARFETHKFGIGRFTFTPVAGQKYRTVLQGSQGQVITRVLPEAQPKGFVMEVSAADTENLKVSVTTNPLAPAQGSHTIYLLAHTRHEVKVAEVAHPGEDGKAEFLVPKQKLGEGITHFTVFNGNKQPVCERLYFTKPVDLLKLTPVTDKQLYSTRSEVKLTVGAKSSSGATDTANSSVAVYRLDSLQAPEKQSIATYLWLTSDLKGQIESPEFYVTQTGAEAELAQDNLMLTHGWSRFKWEQILSNTVERFKYIPEYGGHLVQGSVVDRKSKKPAANVHTYLASPSRTVSLYTATSDSAGRVLFDVRNLYGSQTLVLQADSRKDSTYTFEIDSPFDTAKPTYTLQPFRSISESLEQVLRDKSIHLQVQSYHISKVAPSYTPAATDSIAFYGTPDRVYKLDDYTRFPVMEEVMREYVPPVFVRKRQGKFNFLVIDQPRKTTFDDEPLILLDGVPVFDTDKIMAFDPKKVQRLEIVSRRYYHQGKAYNGVVSYITYAGDLAAFEVDAKALLQEYEGLQLKREFYSPVYTSPEQRASRIPDLRELLYWNPTAVVAGQNSSEYRFYTSDQPGTYLVVVQGISAEGKAGSGTYTFTVKRDENL